MSWLAPSNTSRGPVMSRLCTPGKARNATRRGAAVGGMRRSSPNCALSARTDFQRFLPGRVARLRFLYMEPEEVSAQVAGIVERAEPAAAPLRGQAGGRARAGVC